MTLLRDVPPQAFSEAARAYVQHNALLEGRYRTASEKTLIGEDTPMVFCQVLDVLESNDSLRGMTVPDLEAVVTVANGTGVLARSKAAMKWVPEQLCWRSPTGAVSTHHGAQFIDALHGRVLKSTHDGSAPLPSQFMWKRTIE